MDADTWMVLIFAWVITMFGAWGLGIWVEHKDQKPEYIRGNHFAIQYYQEFNEFPVNDLIEKAYRYKEPKSAEDFITIRKRAGLEFVIPNSLKEKEEK
jgi:hypothetical protein